MSNASDAAVREHFDADVRPRARRRRSSAPGRVNLIGEHTDYNGGYVLPMAIPQRTWVAVAHAAIDHGARVERGISAAAIASGVQRRSARVADEELARLRAGRHAGPGTRRPRASAASISRIVSDVPLGSGLSSSAALEVARAARRCAMLFGLALDDVRLAQLGQRAENDFVGAPVGVMDQMAASLADDRTALFLDTRTLRYEQVPLPAGGGARGDQLRRGAQPRQRRLPHAGARNASSAAAALGVPQLRDLGPGRSAARGRAARAARPPRPPRRHRERAGARVGRRDEGGRPATARRAVHGVARLAARRLRGVGARDRSAGRSGARASLASSARASPAAGSAARSSRSSKRVAMRGIGERVARAYRQRSGQTPTVLVPQSQPGA